MRRVLPVVIALASLCSIGTARANGRFPKAQEIVAAPGSDGTKIYVRATFGILVSNDAGRSWSWVCERALGYEGQWDPPIAVTRDGTLYVGLARGLVTTSDDGCSASPAPELEGQTIRDLTTDPRGETVWAIAGRPGGTSSVWRKSRGKAWERLAAPELADRNVLTIEVAASRPDRLYVSGAPYDSLRGVLYRSDDGGRTFKTLPNEEKPNGPFFIAAVDPKDPDRVLLRHLHTEGSEVLLSTDGGRTLKNVLSMKSAMFGFAKAADGKTYWAGSGLAEDGIFRSTDRGEHFERVASHGVLCLSAIGDHLFACENPMVRGTPVFAVSEDRGATYSPISRYTDIKGPLGCLAGTGDAGRALCGDAWPEMQALFFPPPPTPEDAGAGADAAAPSSTPPPPARRSSCGCSTPGMDRSWTTAGLAPLVLWAGHRRRRGSARAHAGKA